jgi:hypothetical protein
LHLTGKEFGPLTNRYGIEVIMRRLAFIINCGFESSGIGMAIRLTCNEMTTPCRSVEIRFDAFLTSVLGGGGMIKSSYRLFKACGLSPALIRHAAVSSRVQDEGLVTGN